MSNIETAQEIVGSGGGGKKGSGTSADNTLQSKATARIIEAISEGPIVGLVNGSESIYFDETPLKNSDGTYNFDNVNWQQRRGNPDDNSLNGHSAVEIPRSVETEVKVSTGPVIKTVTNVNADAVRVIIRVNSLFKIDDKGKAQVNTLHYTIAVRPFGGVWLDAVTQQLDDEKCTSAVQIAHRVELPVGGYPWDIRVTRVTADSVDDKNLSSFTFESMFELIEGRYIYPHTALIGMKVDAESLGQSVPERAYHIMGRIISVPSNYDAKTRVYTGIWDGTFIEAWTNNPAWIFYDILTNDRYGMGEYINTAEVAGLKWQLYTIGQYCDEMIPSGFKDNAAADILEPRFTFNGVLRNRQEAYHALRSITTSFRGMGYWALGQVFATADIPSDPVKLVTPANVLKGAFSYSSTALKARHSVALVKWNDPNDFYRPSTEMVVNNEALRKFGWREKRMDMLGCTSRGLAHRYGKWALDVENVETETVTYKASFDHMDVAPGEIISIADPRKATVRLGGRIKSHAVLNGTRDEIELDGDVSLVSPWADNTIHLTMPDGTIESHPLTWQSGTNKVRIATAASYAEINSVFIITATDVVPRQYRVLSISEADENIFQITALFHDPGKYARIEQNVTFDPLPYTKEGAVTKVRNLAVDEIAYVDDGIGRSTIRLTWSAPVGVIVREYIVQMKTPTGAKEFFASTKNTTIDIPSLERGNHLFYVTVVDRRGRVGSPNTIPLTVAATDTIAAGVVSNLILTDSGGSTEFFGRTARIEWKNLFPKTSGGAATEENSSLYDFNTVKVYDNSTNTLLRTKTVRGEKFTYSFDHNTRDCAAAALSVVATRVLRFEVTVTSKRNNISAAASLSVSNPVPVAVVPSVSKSAQTIAVSLPAAADSDVRGMKVWVESNNTYDPLITTPKFEGTSGFMNWVGVAGVTYYVRAGYYDFFDDTMSVSAYVAVTTEAIVAPTAPATPTGLALATVILGNGLSRVTATWNANSESDLSGYDLLVSENGGNNVGFSTITEVKYWDVLPGTVLSVSVRATSTASLNSPYTSSASIAAAVDTIAPAAPLNLIATASFEAYWLEWDANLETDLSHYLIRQRIGSNNTSNQKYFTTSSTNFVITGAPAGEKSWFRVYAVDTSGNQSAISNVSSPSSSVIIPTGVTSADIAGIVNTSSFAAGVAPVEVLGALPSTGNFEGRQLFLTTDKKLYRHDGTDLTGVTGWINEVDGADLKLDSINAGVISAGVISSTEIKANTISSKNLIISDLENLIPDGSFSDADPTLFPVSGGASGSFGFTTDTVSGRNALTITKSVLTDTIYTTGSPISYFPIKAGDVYYGETEAKTLSGIATAGFYCRIRWYSATGVYIGFSNIASNTGLTTSWEVFTSAVTAPAGASLAGLWLYNHSANSTVNTFIVDRVVLRKKDGANLVVDGSLTAAHIDTNDLVVNGLATLNTAYIKEANISGTLSAAKITGGSALLGTVTVDGTALSTVESRAADPATRVNAGVVKINPGKISIWGTTADQLTDWRKGGDLTNIDGGKVSANTISANKLKIGSRGVASTVVFTANDPAANKVSWSAGTITYVNDSGISVSVAIASGNTANTTTSGIKYFLWAKDAALITTRNNVANILDSEVILASYTGGTGLVTEFGRTIIDGDYIKTGAIDTTHLDTTSFTASGLAIFGGSVKSSTFAAGTSGWQITNAGAAEFNNLIVRSSLVDGAVTDGGESWKNSGSKYGYLVEIAKITMGSVITPSTVVSLSAYFQRRDGGTYEAWNVDNKTGVGSWVAASIPTRVIVQYQTTTGGVAGSWVSILDTSSSASASWVSHEVVDSKLFNVDDISLRAISYRQDIVADGTSIKNVLYQNNVRKIGLNLRTLPRK